MEAEMEMYNTNGSPNRMILHQQKMSDEVSFLGQRLDFLETQIQTLIQGQEFIIRTLNSTTCHHGNQSKQPSKQPPPKKSKQNKGMKSSQNDVSKLLHLPEALQRNIVRFTDDLSFSQTNIPDQLISSECLSEDECATITSKPSPKDQIRLLVRKMKARGPQAIEKFLDIVGQDHPHLPREVNKTLEEIVNEHKQKPMCVICIMQTTVDLRDIGDHLWQAKIISDDTYDDIYENENFQRNRAHIWSYIIHCINNYETPDDAIQILINALKTKYSHIVEYLTENADRPSLSCSCCRRRRVRPKRKTSCTASLTDESTTSERTQSLYSSQDLFSSSLRQLSLDPLTLSDSMGKVSYDNRAVQSPLSDLTTKDLLELKEYRRQLSSKFVPQDDSENVNNVTKLDPSLPLNASPEDISILVSTDQGNKRPQLMQSVSVVSDITVCDTDEDPTDETENKRSSDLDATADIQNDQLYDIPFIGQNDVIQDTQLYDIQSNGLFDNLQDSKKDIVSDRTAQDVTNEILQNSVKEAEEEADHQKISTDSNGNVSSNDTNDCVEDLCAKMENLKA